MEFVTVSSKEPDAERALAIAQQYCILRGLVGSTVHGLSNPGTDDRDEMGVCIEPPEYLVGLRTFEHCVARSQPEGMPSGPGDIDLNVYGLRKFCRLAMKGSPTTLLLFFVRGDDVIERNELGAELQELIPAFLSAATGRGFLGYLDQQVVKLRAGDLRGRERERSPLHGYDTKYAMHALRIAHQGVELLETGTISLPVQEPARSRLREVRSGTPSLDDILTELRDATERLRRAAAAETLPPEPERERIDQFLVEAYRRAWTGEIADLRYA